MDKKEKKRKILNFLRDNFGQYFGALKIDKALGFDPGGTVDGQHLSWSTHKVLEEMVESGELEQYHGKGFRYKKAS